MLPADVAARLRSSARHLAFRYELLDSANRHKAWLTGVLEGKARVANNALAEIKRTARFDIAEIDDIDYGSDRIRPWCDIVMPDTSRHPVPLGVFLLSSPTRRDESGLVFRDIAAYDQLVILRDDKVADRYTVAAGANYITAVRVLLDSAGIAGQNLTATDKVLPVAMDWPPGTTKLRIVNDLLSALNYRSLYFDAEGTAIAEPYRSPEELPVSHVYRDDDESVTFPGMTEEMDLFDVANKWVLVVSDPERDPLTSTYTNENPASPTSTVSRGRIITDFRDDQDAADQATLDAKAERLAFEASQVVQAVEWETAIMPTHGDAEVVENVYTGLGISARYVSHTWKFDCKAGARMRHRGRRIVAV